MANHINLRNRNLAIMTVLQIILLASHFLVGLIFYTEGKRIGTQEGRIAVRRHYEKLNSKHPVNR